MKEEKKKTDLGPNDASGIVWDSFCPSCLFFSNEVVVMAAVIVVVVVIVEPDELAVQTNKHPYLEGIR